MWAKKLSMYLELSSDAKKSEFCSQLSKSELVAMYNGVAKFVEEMMIFAFQLNSRTGLKIRELARTDRKSDIAIRFVTDLTKSWSLTYSDLPFDEL